MAVIEIQFRQDVFFRIVAAQIVRTDFPRALFPELGPDRLLERIDASPASFPDPADGVLPQNAEILFKVPFIIQHTSFAEARAAGNLQTPVTKGLSCLIWMGLSGSQPPSQISWRLARLDVEGVFRPAFATGIIPLGNLGVSVAAIAMVEGDGVVVLRFGTRAEDPLDGAVVNRISSAEWGQVIAGQVFADTLADTLNAAADDATKDSSDPELDVTSHAAGHWSGTAAAASVDINAVDAIPVIDADVPIVIYAITEPHPNVALQSLQLRTRITWAAHDFVTTISSGAISAVESKVSEKILDKLKPPPGQKEVERADDHVVYESSRPLTELSTGLFKAVIHGAFIDQSGLNATGSVTVYPPPVAFFTLEPQVWRSGADCHTRVWHTEFKPAAVSIFGVDRFINLQFRSPMIVDPDGFWTPNVSWSGFGPGNQTAHVSFDPPPFGLRPSGEFSSAFINTNFGVRWVDLGPVPPRPDPPGNALAIALHMVSQCMAISNRWGLGILNLAWLVDPPDLETGIRSLREWTIASTDFVGIERIDLTVVGPSGERPLASIPVVNSAVFAQVVTDSDETVRLHAPAPVTAPPPAVMQRWIKPWIQIPASQHATPVDFKDGVLYIREESGLSTIELPAQPSHSVGLRARSLDRSDVMRQVTRMPQAPAGSQLMPRTVSRGRSVAVRHRDHIVLGFAGPLVSIPSSGFHVDAAAIRKNLHLLKQQLDSVLSGF